MEKSSINIDITLDDNKVPAKIEWAAANNPLQAAKAMMIGFWDATDKSALRIDLWTKDMMVDEMADFYYQMLMGMSDSLRRATKQEGLSGDLKNFAKVFFEKFRAIQLEEQK